MNQEISDSYTQRPRCGSLSCVSFPSKRCRVAPVNIHRLIIQDRRVNPLFVRRCTFPCRGWCSVILQHDGRRVRRQMFPALRRCTAMFDSAERHRPPITPPPLPSPSSSPQHLDIVEPGDGGNIEPLQLVGDLPQASARNKEHSIATTTTDRPATVRLKNGNLGRA